MKYLFLVTKSDLLHSMAAIAICLIISSCGTDKLVYSSNSNYYPINSINTQLNGSLVGFLYSDLMLTVAKNNHVFTSIDHINWSSQEGATYSDSSYNSSTIFLNNTFVDARWDNNLLAPYLGTDFS